MQTQRAWNNHVIHRLQAEKCNLMPTDSNEQILSCRDAARSSAPCWKKKTLLGRIHEDTPRFRAASVLFGLSRLWPGWEPPEAQLLELLGGEPRLRHKRHSYDKLSVVICHCHILSQAVTSLSEGLAKSRDKTYDQ